MLVEGNTIKDSALQAIAVFGAGNVSVINNRLVDNDRQHSLPGRVGFGSLYVDNSSAVNISYNTQSFAKADHPFETALYVQANSTKDVVVQGNVGFQKSTIL